MCSALHPGPSAPWERPAFHPAGRKCIVFKEAALSWFGLQESSRKADFLASEFHVKCLISLSDACTRTFFSLFYFVFSFIIIGKIIRYLKCTV